MTDYLYTENQVREMWKRSYGTQIGIAQAKCFEAIVRMDGKIAVSFSGGKDSAVVLYLMAEAWSISKHKDEPLQVFFSNTTNEFTSMLPYIREYIKYIEAKFEIKIKFEIVRGEYTYFQVIDMVGLPFVSKKVARMVRDVKATLKRLNLKYADIEPLMPKAFTDKHIPERIETAEKLRALGFNNVVILYLTGVTSENKTSIRRFLPLQYRPLLDAPFELSEKCCDYLKKKPLKIENKKLGGLLPVTGEMASDTLIKTVQQTIDPDEYAGEGYGVAPIGHIVKVKSAEKIEVTVKTNITFDAGYGWSNLQSSIDEAISNYLLELRKSWADNPYLVVRISQIETRLLNIKGIVDIANTKLNGASENLTLGKYEVPMYKGASA